MVKVSNSRLNQYRKCPRAYYYAYEARIEPQEDGETEHDRSFGSAIHSGLKVLYKGGTTTIAVAQFKAEYPKSLVEDDLAKTPENGALLLEAYWKQNEPQLKNWKILDVEVLQEYEPIEGLIFRVKLDLIAENKQYGGVYGFDWKTTGKKLDYKYWAQFNPNAQISTYFDFIAKKYSQCAGFYIDAMSFGFRQRKYKNEPAGFHYKLNRELFTQTKDQLNEWLDSEQEWLDKLNRSAERQKWPMNTNQCTYCSYRPICSAGWTWQNDKDLILAQYKQRPIAEQVGVVDESISE